MDKLDFSGIKVSAEELVVALQREGKRRDLKTFPNTAAGHQAVIRHLSCPGRTVRVVLESTGLYGLDLALALQRAQLEVMVANPRAVRHFAQALMQRSKNDRLDAGVAGGCQAWKGMRAANSSSTQASSRSFLLRCISAWAKWRTARGLATITSS